MGIDPLILKKKYIGFLTVMILLFIL